MKKISVMAVIICLFSTYLLTACSAPGYGPVANTNQPTSTIPSTGTPLVQINNKASLGDYLVGASLRVLYYHTADSANQSNCSGACATTWPPFLASELPQVSPNIKGTLGLITRADGGQQVTYNGWPLYYYSGDVNLGDTNGQGINNIWYVVSPNLAPSVIVPTTPTQPPANSPTPNYNY
jgi:predicted lipoprotein with Yx(FWY)xxD motif